MDDFNWQNAVYQSAAARNRSILSTLNAHSIKAALFVIGRNVENEEGTTTLRRVEQCWSLDRKSHLLASESKFALDEAGDLHS
jgi:hypothetical protein